MSSSDAAHPLKKKKKKRKAPEPDPDHAPIPIPIPIPDPAPKPTSEPIEVTMEFLPSHPAPFVGYFPSGFDPATDPDAAVKLYRHKRRPNRVELVVSPSGRSKVDFVGKSYSGEAAAPQLCSYLVGVFDRESRTLKILPVATNKILRLEPRVKGKTYVDDLIDEAKDGSVEEERKIDKLRSLTNLYGSKKSKNLTRRYQALEEQQNNPDAKEYLENQIKDVNDHEEAVEGSGFVVFNIPPHDLAATTPEKAYLLDKIIPKAEWNLLSDILEIVKSGKDLDSTSKIYRENAYPCFVLSRLRMIREAEDEKKKKELAHLLSYITHLMNFRSVAASSWKSPAPDYKYNSCNIPRTILQKFKQLFLDPESQKLATDKTDLLVCYILVLTLFVDNFETDMSDIAKDLQKPRSSMHMYYKQLGCKVWGKSATLPVPLKIPSMKVMRRKRK